MTCRQVLLLVEISQVTKQQLVLCYNQTFLSPISRDRKTSGSFCGPPAIIEGPLQIFVVTLSVCMDGYVSGWMDVMYVFAIFELIQSNSYTPRTLRVCCSRSEFEIPKMRRSRASALVLYNCTLNIVCTRECSVVCINTHVGLIHLLFGEFYFVGNI